MRALIIKIVFDDVEILDVRRRSVNEPLRKNRYHKKSSGRKIYSYVERARAHTRKRNSNYKELPTPRRHSFHLFKRALRPNRFIRLTPNVDFACEQEHTSFFRE